MKCLFCTASETNTRGSLTSKENTCLRNSFTETCRSAHTHPECDTRATQAAVSLRLNPGSHPELCRAHSCFRFDQATLSLGKNSYSEVKFGLSRDRDKGAELRMCTNLQGARLWCNQCNAPRSTEPLLPLRVQGHSCSSNTDTLRQWETDVESIFLKTQVFFFREYLRSSDSIWKCTFFSPF